MPNYKVVVIRENLDSEDAKFAEQCNFVVNCESGEELQKLMNNVENLPDFEPIEEDEEQVLVFETPEPSTHKIDGDSVKEL